MARTAERKRSAGRSGSGSGTSATWRSPSPRTISRACASFATGRPRGSRSPPGSTAGTFRTSSGCSTPGPKYGWDLPYFERMLDAGAVDVLQADVTRCGGITGLLHVGGLCAARGVPFSAHCAPAISTHACTAVETLAHLEYFHDHVRIEGMLFDGGLSPRGGYLEPDRGRPGLGLELRRADARRFER